MTQLFPKWTNKLPALGTVSAAFGAPLVVFLIWYYFSPQFIDVGYAPDQPVPYSHKLHAGMFGMDCRYCHQNAERGAHATIPATQTCMNCHEMVKPKSELLKPIRDSYASGDAVPWVKIHDLPDYAYFDHSAHVRISPDAGIGCATCHGRIDHMEVVRQAKTLSMGWCLECHRNPEKHIRPTSKLTDMAYEHDQAVTDALMKAEADKNRPIKPPTHCSACHR